MGDWMRDVSAALPDGVRVKLASSLRTLVMPLLLRNARRAHGSIPKARSLHDPRVGTTVTEIDFRCNVCGSYVRRWPLAALGRGLVSCLTCNSFGRARSIVHILSVALHGRSMALPDWPVRKDIKGIGLSDWAGYAGRLPAKVDYRNTFFHKAPRLDVCAPPQALDGSLDFVISGDVFEHVPPPASRAFTGVARMLKPGGVMVLTVPYAMRPDTIEHFPDLHEFKLDKRDGEDVLVNMRKDGRVEVHRNLVFHGGPGATLEMRVFGREALLAELTAAGFTHEGFLEQPVLEWGIVQWGAFNHPILARKAG